MYHQSCSFDKGSKSQKMVPFLEPFRIWQFDLVEYVHSNWNLISAELLLWNRALVKAIVFGPTSKTRA